MNNSGPKSADLIDLKKRRAEIRRKNQPVLDPGEERARTRMQLAGLVVTAVLVAAGWLLVHELRKTTAVEDCFMSGRTNCMPIDVTPLTH